MPKQVFDQYRSELTQGEEKPWYDFSDLPVWSGTLPGTPQDAAHISTELAKDISPVVGPYRSGVRSTREYNKMMGLIDEGDYTGAIEPGLWSLLESADVGLSSLPLLGGILAAPIDLARAVRPIFTSPAKKSVSEVTKEALPAQQWMKQLEGRGVKKDELEWTGLGDFLKGRKGNITKTEVDEFIEANQIQIREVVRGGNEGVPLDWDAIGDIMRKHDIPGDISPLENEVHFAGKIIKEYGEKLSPEEIDYLSKGILSANQTDSALKYGNPEWQLPGGDNYRELVLSLPGKNIPYTKEEIIGPLPEKRGVGWQTDFYWFDTPIGYKKASKLDYNSAEEAHAGVLLQLNKRKQPENKFTGGHFPEDNILAWVRFNERIDPDGKKVLFIEEIQSDWAQKGRKQGFITDSVEEVQKLAHADRSRFYSGKGNMPDEEWKELSRRVKEFDEREKIASKGIPRAPFMEDTNQWANLSLKRMIRWGTDNGFDSISWTTGKQQAARYNLSTQIDTLEVAYADPGEFILMAKKDNLDVLSNIVVKEAELADHVGKEMAEKIIRKARTTTHSSKLIRIHKRLDTLREKYNGSVIDNAGLEKDPEIRKKDMKEFMDLNFKIGQEAPKRMKFEGLDLEVGGEGMAGFYDDIVVNQAKKIGKKYGAKVEKTDLVRSGRGKYSEVPQERMAEWEQTLEQRGIETIYDDDAGDQGLVMFQRLDDPEGDWFSAEEMVRREGGMWNETGSGMLFDPHQINLAEQITEARRRNWDAQHIPDFDTNRDYGILPHTAPYRGEKTYEIVRETGPDAGNIVTAGFKSLEEAQEELAKLAKVPLQKVWTMKLTDKLKKAAKEGLPYYAVMPPTLLAAGAQEERQSLLE